MHVAMEASPGSVTILKEARHTAFCVREGGKQKTYAVTDISKRKNGSIN